MDPHIDLFSEEQNNKENKTYTFDESGNTCIFCNKSGENDILSKPDINKLDSLLHACKERNDFVGNKILQHTEKIRNGDIKIKYHRDCRSTYCSIWHISRSPTANQKRNCENQNENDFSTSAKKRITRNTTTCNSEPSFDWKANCFICGKSCAVQRKSEWSMVQSSITNSNGTMYQKVLEAAMYRDDQVMLVRLSEVSNGDLVAIEARYHRKKNCYSSYIRPRSVFASQKQNELIKNEDNALKQLVSELQQQIVEEKQVFLMSTIKERYQKLISSLNQTQKCNNLKSRLTSECQNISFIAQPGKSDLVCSKLITVGEVLLKAELLVDVVQEMNVTNNQTEVIEQEDETDIILHKAAGILRKSMTKTKKLENEYFSFDEISLKAEKEFIDPKLYKFIAWLADTNTFTNALDPNVLELNPQVLHIACDIVTLATSVSSPKHLGLAVYLQNEFGSRKLIDTMFNLGYSISYTELRQFITSASSYVASLQSQTNLGSYIPPEIKPTRDGGSFLVACADNWDHNERTVDGKRTTHAMTSIIVQRQFQSENNLIPTRIKRTSRRSLDLSSVSAGELFKIIHYNKPTRRPEPSFSPPVLSVNEIIPSKCMTDAISSAYMTETIYNISRTNVFHDERYVSSHVPPWSVYHSILNMNKHDTDPSKIAFNPIIMAPPTDPSTVFTTLLRLKETANTLGQEHIPVFFDMGLLCKALEVTWSKPDELNGVIPCVGGM